MSIPAELLRSHISYNSWANRRLVKAAAQLTSEQLNQDFKTADRSVLDTLVHVFAAERLWLSRLQGGPHPGFVTEADRHLSVLQEDWPQLEERWGVWASGLDDIQSNAVVSYKDMKGNPWSQVLGELVLHVVNHGTHHRGQVSGFLRTLGQTPPPLDLVFYYREVATP